ncbi:MAG: SUMF1/EgtB/PvdO family nonheme iron enzyme [Pseudomonadota bacterium]
MIGVVLALALAGSAEAQVAGETFRDCETCPEMTQLIDGTAIGTYLVTRDEFAEYAADWDVPETSNCFIWIGKRASDSKEHGWADPGFEQAGDHPVVCVNWLEATGYADWLSEKTGQLYRLPTIEESRAAAFAGTQTRFWWGDSFDEVCQWANVGDEVYRAAHPDDQRDVRIPCEDGFPFTSPVGAFPPNGLGLHDVVGNVYQWTNSCNKGDCSNAIFRGGAWNVPRPFHLSNEGEWADRIVLRGAAVGFRVMRDAE